MNRVVITGHGITSPAGNEPETFSGSLKTGKDSIEPISKFDASETGVTLAAEVEDFPMGKYFVKKDGRRMDKLSLLSIYAALEAVAMSDLGTSQLDADRFGVMTGSGIGGLETIQNQIIRMYDKGPKRVALLLIPMAIGNMAAGNIALRVGAKGICTSTMTVCVSATRPIGGMFRNIKHSYPDVIIAGGVEVPITRIGISGLASLTALTKAADSEKASIPFDKEHSGFVMGEGAGVFILKSLDRALERGTTILGEVVGYGANYDAYRVTSPTLDRSGAAKTMVLVMEEAGVSPEKAGYISAYGTSTQANDNAESKAIELALSDAVKTAYVSSTKSMTGHPLDTAGRAEGIATLNASQHQFIPPAISVGNQDEVIMVNVVLNESKEHKFDYALGNSLGFGGHNVVICPKRWGD